MSIATAELRAELRKEISEWKARTFKAEADAKGWEEMHDKAAKSRDENLAARLKAEEALREIVERFDDPSIWTETVAAKMAWIAREALDKPGTEAMDEVIEYVNCPKCGGRAVSVTHKIAALEPTP